MCTTQKVFHDNMYTQAKNKLLYRTKIILSFTWINPFAISSKSMQSILPLCTRKTITWFNLVWVVDSCKKFFKRCKENVLSAVAEVTGMVRAMWSNWRTSLSKVVATAHRTWFYIEFLDLWRLDRCARTLFIVCSYIFITTSLWQLDWARWKHSSPFFQLS